MPRHGGVMKGWHANEVKAEKIDPFNEKDFRKMPCLCRYGLSISVGYQDVQQDTSELFISLSSMSEESRM